MRLSSYVIYLCIYSFVYLLERKIDKDREQKAEEDEEVEENDNEKGEWEGLGKEKELC